MELVRKTNPQKNIIQNVLDTLTDYNSSLKNYNNAIDDYNELGGIDKIAEVMEWDDSQKENWKLRIKQVYNIK